MSEAPNQAAQAATTLQQALNLADNYRAMLAAHIENTGEELDSEDQVLVTEWDGELGRLKALPTPDYERLATMGAFWLTLLIDRTEIDAEATVINVTARTPDGSRRDLTKISLAEAMQQFKDAGIDAGSLADGLI